MQLSQIRIGTRGSPLALAQAHEARGRLAASLCLPQHAISIVAIRTTGDRITDRSLSDLGGKGLFTKEIDGALLAGSVDIAVHSAKDLPTAMPDGITIAATLPREDVRDAFLSPSVKRLVDLPEGAVLGTSSLRRKAMALRIRPDLRIVDLRGKVETRIRKLEERVADATILAMAGLNRLGLAHQVASVIDFAEWLPAVAQGTIAIAARSGDVAMAEALAAIDDGETSTRLRAERAFLTSLEGSCRTPIGGLAEWKGDRLVVRGIIVRADGSEAHAGVREGAAGDAERLAADLGEELRRAGGERFFDF